MPSEYEAEENSASTIKLRRSARLSNIIKSEVKGQSVSPQEGQLSSSKKRRRPPSKKRSASTVQPVSSQEGQPSSSKKRGKPPCKKRSASTGQLVSSLEGQPSTTRKRGRPPSKKRSTSTVQRVSSQEGQPSSSKKRGRPPSKKRSASTSSSEEQSTSTKNTPRKRRHVMKMDEIDEGKELEDFSTPILQILEEIFPDLEMEQEAIDDMNIFINHIFERLAMSASFNTYGKCITSRSIERAVTRIIDGPLYKYCLAEGIKALKNMNEVQI